MAQKLICPVVSIFCFAARLIAGVRSTRNSSAPKIEIRERIQRATRCPVLPRKTFFFRFSE
jgi:hypothetical protein